MIDLPWTLLAVSHCRELIKEAQDDLFAAGFKVEQIAEIVALWTTRTPEKLPADLNPYAQVAAAFHLPLDQHSEAEIQEARENWQKWENDNTKRAEFEVFLTLRLIVERRAEQCSDQSLMVAQAVAACFVIAAGTYWRDQDKELPKHQGKYWFWVTKFGGLMRETKAAQRWQSVSKELVLSEHAKYMVSFRDDQVDKKAFQPWFNSLPIKPKNVREMEAMEGFLPAWSRWNDEALKDWAKELGHTFKGGRPSKPRASS